jgi:hypothetical protein
MTLSLARTARVDQLTGRRERNSSPSEFASNIQYFVHDLHACNPGAIVEKTAYDPDTGPDRPGHDPDFFRDGLRFWREWRLPTGRFLNGPGNFLNQ